MIVNIWKNLQAHPKECQETEEKRQFLLDKLKLRHECYSTNHRRLLKHSKKCPFCEKLLPIGKNINFEWGRAVYEKFCMIWVSSVKKLLNRMLLNERPDIVDSRCHYLIPIKQLENEGRKLFYTDEIWINTILTFNKCWQGENLKVF